MLSDILKQKRKNKGLTFIKLSHISGISVSHLARIERGERFPSARILKKLSNPLGSTETELLEIAGYLTNSNERVERIKEEIKGYAIEALINLWKKVDKL